MQAPEEGRSSIVVGGVIGIRFRLKAKHFQNAGVSSLGLASQMSKSGICFNLGLTSNAPDLIAAGADFYVRYRFFLPKKQREFGQIAADFCAANGGRFQFFCNCNQ